MCDYLFNDYAGDGYAMRTIPDPPAPFATLYGETVLLPPPPPPPPVFACPLDAVGVCCGSVPPLPPPPPSGSAPCEGKGP